MSKSKIDKITYSKSQSRATYDAKISLQCILKVDLYTLTPVNYLLNNCKAVNLVMNNVPKGSDKL